MTNEERMKKIEELGIKSDKMGLIPLDFYEIFKEHTYKMIDQAVVDLEKDENRELLAKIIRESSDSEVIYAKILFDTIKNCNDSCIKEFLEEIFEEKEWDYAYISDYSDDIDYQSGPLDYIVQYIEKPLDEIEKKYKPYYEIFKEEKEIFGKYFEEARRNASKDGYNVREWNNRKCDLTNAVDDIACFKKPYFNEYDQDVNEEFEHNTKTCDACSEIDQILNNNFSQIMKITSEDFEVLVDIITETEIFKNSSVYIKNKVLKEIVKEAMKYNVNTTKHEKKFAEPVEPLTIANSDLEEIKEDINIKIK